MKLTKQSEDFSQWYLDLVQIADLADYSPVKGCMIIKPYGYKMWELIQQDLNKRMEAMHVENAYFPLLIPEDFIKKEAEHVEGFAPELLTVDRVGTKKIDPPYVIRPTSETIIYDSYAKWIHSYRDLPLKMNQWANIMRWEKRTRPFLRTSEFLWQEGHTVHATETEADEMVMDALNMYDAFEQEVLAFKGVKGKKSEAEKFPGAKYTTTLEVLARDGKAIQSGTSHNLGQGFSQAFNIQFTDTDEKIKHPWITSWGVSTRLIGALIIVHGDDKGLRLPPPIAPIQVIIIPIARDEASKKDVMNEVYNIEQQLKSQNIRVKIDQREDKRPGFKFAEWEVKGVPIRMEIGPKDLEKQQVVCARRDTNEKFPLNITEISQKIPEVLEDIHDNLLQESIDFTQNNTTDVFDFEQFQETLEKKGGFIKASWCGDAACEKKIQEKTKATSRCIPFEGQSSIKGNCIHCEKEAQHIAIFAKAY
jgi:prolyl-tRNA synthetase